MLLKILLFILDTVCGFFTLALLVRFVMQWVRAPFRNPLGQFIVAVTDWMVRPVRRLIPGLFGLDMASLFLAWLWQVPTTASPWASAACWPPCRWRRLLWSWCWPCWKC
jgi:YggT family protein